MGLFAAKEEQTMTKTQAPKAVFIIGLLFTLIGVLGCGGCGKNSEQERDKSAVTLEQQPSSQTRAEKPLGSEEIRVGNSTYYIEKDKPVNTRILEIAIDTDDQAVINAFLYKAKSGDANAIEAMRTANPERFISLVKRGKYPIDAQALQFLKIMDGFGNRYANEAIKAMGK
jgi:hypothetical protein